MISKTSIVSAVALAGSQLGFAQNVEPASIVPAFSASVDPDSNMVTFTANQNSPAVTDVQNGFVVLDERLNEFLTQPQQLGVIASSIPSEISFKCAEVSSLSAIYDQLVTEIVNNVKDAPDAVAGISATRIELANALQSCPGSPRNSL